MKWAEAITLQVTAPQICLRDEVVCSQLPAGAN
jgi:hypothetical protein